MAEIPVWQVVVLGCVGALSLAVWVWLAFYKRGRLELLDYQPRRRVPWLLGGALFTLLMVVPNLAASFMSGPLADAEAATAVSTEEDISTALAISLQSLIVLAAILFWMILGCKAKFFDLGLPRSLSELGRDMVLGLVTAIAAMVPVYVLNAALVTLLDWHEQHPALERLTQGGGWQLAATSILTAVIMAPLCEEVIFRLWMQGGLEALEDRHLNWKPSEREVAVTGNGQDRKIEAERTTSYEQPQNSENPFQSPLAVDSKRPTEIAPIHELDDATRQQRCELVSVGRLPHGWAPILATAALFGLAHGGQGPAPIPLFLFAVMLGYLYQRTHRITPSIFAHMAFNGFSLAMVWFGSQ